MSNSNISEHESAMVFVEQGFQVFDLMLSDSYEILKISIANRLKELVSEDVQLENYHLFVTDKKEHTNIQYSLFNLVHDLALHKQVVQENLGLFKTFFGPDIDIQVKPYIRIARPDIPDDNIGFHWDTFYGNSAFETSCVLPLTENREQGVLQLAPGSHRWESPEVVQYQSEDVVKGQEKNQMGFLYAPKVIKDLDYSKVHPVMVKPGQALLFSLGVLHGQEINSDKICRWSIDFRLKNSFAPVSRNLKKGYYQTLSKSPLSVVSAEYYSNKTAEKALLTGDF